MIDHAGITLAGPADGPTVLLLHGGGANRFMWSRLIAALEDRFRVLAIDLPGHGDRRSERFSVRSAVRVATDALDEHAATQASIVGMSLGGYVAIALAGARPHRVTSLVLSGATAEYLGWGGLTTRLTAIPFRVAPRFLGRKSEEALRSIVASDLAEPMLAAGMSMRGAADALWDLPGRDYHAMLTPYRGPLLILNGERDRENRRSEARAVANWRQAKVATIRDAGHACVLTQPDRFAEAVRSFLDDRRPI